MSSVNRMPAADRRETVRRFAAGSAEVSRGR
jgi:hypothetical protein